MFASGHQGEEKVSLKDKLLFLLIIASAVLLLILNFVIFYSPVRLNDNPTVSGTIESVDYWQTYIDEDYGFSFDHPFSATVERPYKNSLIIREADSFARLKIVENAVFGQAVFKEYPNPDFYDYAEYAVLANSSSGGPDGLVYVDKVKDTFPVDNQNGVLITGLYANEISKYWPEGSVADEVVTEKTVGPIYAIDAAGKLDGARIILLIPDDFTGKPISAEAIDHLLTSFSF